MTKLTRYENKEKQKKKILKYLTKNEFATMTEIKNYLNVCWLTARTYLFELTAEHKIIKTQKENRLYFKLII